MNPERFSGFIFYYVGNIDLSILTEYQRKHLAKRRPLWATCVQRNLEALARFAVCKSMAGLMRRCPSLWLDGIDRLIPSCILFLYKKGCHCTLRKDHENCFHPDILNNALPKHCQRIGAQKAFR